MKYLSIMLILMLGIGISAFSPRDTEPEFKFEVSIVEDNIEIVSHAGEFKWKPTQQELLNIANEEAHGVIFDKDMAEKTKTGYLMPVQGTNGPCGDNPQASRYYYETSSGTYYCCSAGGCESAPCPYCPGGGGAS